MLQLTTNIPATIESALLIGRRYRKLKPHLKPLSHGCAEATFNLPIIILEQCLRLSQLPDSQLFVMLMDDYEHLDQHDERWTRDAELDWRQVRVERMERILLKLT